MVVVQHIEWGLNVLFSKMNHLFNTSICFTRVWFPFWDFKNIYIVANSWMYNHIPWRATFNLLFCWSTFQYFSSWNTYQLLEYFWYNYRYQNSDRMGNPQIKCYLIHRYIYPHWYAGISPITCPHTHHTNWRPKVKKLQLTYINYEKTIF